MGIKLTINQNRCKGCELCVSVCPRNLLALEPENVNVKGYHPVMISDMDNCVGCVSCARICPDSVITIEKE